MTSNSKPSKELEDILNYHRFESVNDCPHGHSEMIEAISELLKQEYQRGRDEMYAQLSKIDSEGNGHRKMVAMPQHVFDESLTAEYQRGFVDGYYEDQEALVEQAYEAGAEQYQRGGYQRGVNEPNIVDLADQKLIPVYVGIDNSFQPIDGVRMTHPGVGATFIGYMLPGTPGIDIA